MYDSNTEHSGKYSNLFLKFLQKNRAWMKGQFKKCYILGIYEPISLK